MGARVDLFAYAQRVEPCPDCEVLCQRWGADLWDIPAEDVSDVLIPAVGLREVLQHGTGVTRKRHRCPPTWSDLTPIRPRTDPAPEPGPKPADCQEPILIRY